MEDRLRSMEDRMARYEQTIANLQNQVTVLFSLVSAQQSMPAGGVAASSVARVGVPATPPPAPTPPTLEPPERDLQHVQPPRRPPAPGAALAQHAMVEAVDEAETSAAAEQVAAKTYNPTERALPAPVDCRRRAYTADDRDAMQAALQKLPRDEPAAEGGMLGALWRPRDSWDRYVATFGATEVEPARAVRLQAPTGVAVSTEEAALWLTDVDAHTLRRVLSDRDLAGMGEGHIADVCSTLRALTDGALLQVARYVDDKLQGTADSVPTGGMLTALARFVEVLLWHSIPAVGDALEVVYRVLLLQRRPDATGQAQLLQIAARLSALEPVQDEVAWTPEGQPYSPRSMAQRVERIAGDIQQLLQKHLSN